MKSMNCFTEEQLNKIASLIREIEKLSDVEKLFLYLQLPCGRVDGFEGKFYLYFILSAYSLLFMKSNRKPFSRTCRQQGEQVQRKRQQADQQLGPIFKETRPGDHSNLHLDSVPLGGGPERILAQAGGLRRVPGFLPNELL